MAAVRGKEPFVLVLVRADNPRRINGTKNTRVLNSSAGHLIEETFACGEPV
jgi:hypothetical protein